MIKFRYSLLIGRANKIDRFVGLDQKSLKNREFEHTNLSPF